MAETAHVQREKRANIISMRGWLTRPTAAMAWLAQ
jgi:hypothetical protein